jgi:uncharacterized membrane protein
MKRALVLGLAGVLLLGACSSAKGESTKPSTTTSTVKAATSDRGSSEAVAISADGFSPHWVVVVLHGTVTFTNHTTTTQQIVFDNAFDAQGAPLTSPAIAPGTAWVWTADTFASFAYHSPQLPGVDGRIQVDPPAEP